jgi:hypothetical protein
MGRTGVIIMKCKIITITLGYETDDEFAHILQGLMEALPATSRVSIEQWFNLNAPEHQIIRPPNDDIYDEFTE